MKETEEGEEEERELRRRKRGGSELHQSHPFQTLILENEDFELYFLIYFAFKNNQKSQKNQKGKISIN